jgi:signal transduction histidine kinase
LREAATGQGHLAIASFGSSRTDVWPDRELAFVTTTPEATQAPPASSALVAAEAAETVDRDYSHAIRLYSVLLAAAGPNERPVFVHRLARTYRKAGRTVEALARFRQLQATSQPIGVLRADLIGSFEVCASAADPLQRDVLPACARELYSDLVQGRWRLDKPRYSYYSATARDWLEQAGVNDAPLAELDRVEMRKRGLADLITGVFPVPGQAGPNGAPSTARVTATADHVVLSWADPAPGPPSHYAIAVSREWLDARIWPDRVVPDADGDVDVEIAAEDRGVIFRSGAPIRDADDARAFFPAPSAWKLSVPLAVRAHPRDAAQLAAEPARRQTVYLVGLGAIVMLMGFGAYFTARVVRQELAVAELKADFVSAVSHEFRSPLTGIRQLGEMLMRGRVTSEERRQEYYERITHESDRLGRLVENLLDFSRMDAGRREYRMEPLDPGPWLRDLAVTFLARCPDCAPRIEARIPATLPSVAADREALASAVENLLDNAMKYSPGRPTVWLSAEATAEGIVIRVRDAGVGIVEADRAHVFDAFRRGSGEANRRVKGAGIGLSLVRHIVEAHGGRIEYQSGIGEGTTFALHLPALIEAAKAMDAPRLSRT